MLTLRSVAAVYHKIPASELTPGLLRGFGRSLKHAEIETQRKNGITYIKVREGTTPEGVIKKMKRLKMLKKTQVRIKDHRTDLEAPAPAPTLAPIVDRDPQPAPMTQPSLFTTEQLGEAGVKITIDKLLRTIAGLIGAKEEAEQWATEQLAQKDDRIASLEAQLHAVKSKLLTKTVEKAIIKYGD